MLLKHLIANVSAAIPGGAAHPLGRATPQNSWFTGTLEHRRSQTIVLELDLAGERLEALERLRAGGSLVFHFDLSLHVHRPERNQPGTKGVWIDVQPGSERVQLPVNTSDWTEVLRQLRYLDVLLVAVDLPIDAPDELRETVKLLREAHADLIAGRYNPAVGCCRLAMESVGTLISSESTRNQIKTALAGTKEIREAMSTGDRAERVRMAARQEFPSQSDAALGRQAERQVACALQGDGSHKGIVYRRRQAGAQDHPAAGYAARPSELVRIRVAPSIMRSRTRSQLVFTECPYLARSNHI